MVDLSRNIDNLTGLLRGVQQDKLKHEYDMKNLGLAQIGLQNQSANIAGQQGLDVAKLERENFLNEPVTMRQLFMTRPGKSPEEAQAAIDSLPKEMKPFLDNPEFVFPRGKWHELYRNTRAGMAKAQAEQQRHEELMGERRLTREQSAAQSGLDRASRERIAKEGLRTTEKVAGMRSEKDTSSTMQKEVEYIAKTKGVAPVQALEEWKLSKSLPERIRLFNNEIDALNEDLDLMGPDKAQEKAMKVEQLRQMYGVGQQDLGLKAPQKQADYMTTLPPGFQLDQ